jgi:predicted RNase H-like nuclease (RuvC/YqgF family)
MILGGNTPHGLTRANGLIVFGLALFLLPLVPVWGQAQEDPEAKKRIVLRLAEDTKAAQTDLKAAEAEIEKRAAELAALKAKMAAMKAKLAAEARAKAAEALARVRVAAGQRTAGPVIRIEISGLDLKADELKELIKKLEAVLPGKDKKVIIQVGADRKVEVFDARSVRERVRFGAGGAGGTVVVVPRAPEPPARPGAPVRARAGVVVRPGVAPPGVPAAPPGEKRIEALEKKLDLLLRELEALRKEMSKSRPRGGAGGAGGFGGGPNSPAKSVNVDVPR